LTAGWLPLLFTGWVGTFLLTPAIYGNPIEALGFVALALIVTFLAPSLLRRGLRWLGIYSYFIFFSHFLLIYVIAEVMTPNVFEGQSEWMFAPITLLATLGIILVSAPFAWASMRYFERPMQALGKKFDQSA
jgi:peptidoglycan/LPS O-acetylase OafA/YrhL